MSSGLGQRRWFVLLMLLCCGAAMGAEAPKTPAQRSAEKEYQQARTLAEQEDVDGAIAHARAAAADDPANTRYTQYAELLVQIESEKKLRASEELRRRGDLQLADEVLRSAMAKDPANPDLLGSAHEAAIASAGVMPAIRLSDGATAFDDAALESKDPNSKHTFHLRGMSDAVLKQLFSQFGIQIVTDPAVRNKQVRFDISEADYAQASTALLQLTHTFLVPVTPKEAVAYDDNQESRRSHEHLVLQTFEVDASGGPQEVTQLVGILRSVFELRTVAQSGSKLVIRGAREQVEAAAEFLRDVATPRPEVVLEIRTYEVSRSLLRNIGLQLPLQYQVINVGTVVSQLGASNLQDLANKISAGTIDPSLLTPAIQGLLSQLQSQQGLMIGLIGGGKTQTAVLISPPSFNFSESRNSVRILRSALVRAQQGTTATFRDGLRYPIATTTFSSAIVSPLLNRLAGSEIQPAPEVQYEDLGLTLKLTPMSLNRNDVRSLFDMEIRQLGGSSVNGIPVISNRQFTGTVDLREGETSYIVGSINESDTRGAQGLPGLAQIPGFGAIGSSLNRDQEESELLIAVTPRAVRRPAHESTAESLGQ